MAIVLDGTSGITNDSGYTGDGVSFADSTPANTLVTTDAGNVGIGTSSPGRNLTINATIPILQLTNPTSGTTANDGLLIYQNGLNAYFSNQEAGAVIFETNNAERARITSSGELFVGASTLTGTLGVINAEGVLAEKYAIRSHVPATGSNGQIGFTNPNGLVGLITTSGSSTTYATSSDYRLKHDIQPMTGALAKVQQLKPCTYKWNADDSEDEGFIAHELAEVCPQAVSGEKDAVNEDGSIKPQGIDTSFLVATLTAAIQEQQAIITALTARVEAQEVRLTSLEGAQA